jgi:hypothetical protein
MTKVVYIDVDDTLVRSLGSKRSPVRSVVNEVRRLYSEGAQLYLWSTGGAQYAKEAAAELGISECFIGFLPKPNAYIDDQAVDEWRGCKHILPGNALILVCLGCVFERDRSIRDLGKLPLGWQASRKEQNAPWTQWVSPPQQEH